MSAMEIAALEKQILELRGQLNTLRRESEPVEVPDYEFRTCDGATSLSELFGDREQLLVIHNMGQGCRYCTLWADGFNGFVAHLESVLAVVLVSKDPPALQRQFANSRGWRFRLASHGGGAYLQEQSVIPGEGNMPGAVVYKKENGRICRANATTFGPGDLYCSMWGLLALAGMDESSWTPQYNYWQRPAALDDGGANVLG
ncbi:MAG: DUF899 family protein [Pseudomonadota bacterium]